MLYYLFRYWVNWSARCFFSKTFFTGIDKLPDNKPLILAVNHPTAFIEPMYMGSASLKARNFMLRGDMFGSGKFAAWALSSVKCIPIYRAVDGMANLKKNEEILNYCYDLLGKGDNIYINCEGDSKHEKRLRTIQKGLARMAFGAYEKHGRKDILIIPAGINYSNSNEFRSKVYANFGKPIPLADFFEDYEKNPRRGIKRLTDRLAKELRTQVIHIEKEADDELANKLLLVAENDHVFSPFPMISSKPSPLFDFIDLIERFNGMEEEVKANLKSKVDAYFAALEKHQLKDSGIAQPQYYSWKTTLSLIIGFLPFLIGLIPHLPLVGFITNFANTKIKQEKFYSSVIIAFGAVLYPFYLIILLGLALFFGNLWWGAMVLCLPVFAHFSVLWIDYATKWRAAKNAINVGEKTLMSLKKMRSELKINFF
jgi:1-acyl-sn-glycerol-3-phosphate acyltransferase